MSGLAIQNKQTSLGPSQKVQTKLTIGSSNDKYEREADAMADRIMRMPQTFSSQPMSSGAEGIQRKCAACEKEEEIQRKPLMMKSEGGTPMATPALSKQLSSSKGGGSPLPSATNSFMSQAFGTDFSNVRVHTGARAAQMNQGLQARAFTHGSDIYFNRGQYNPGSSEGKRLLGHELTHVVQQGGRKQKGIQRHTLENDPATAPGMSCTIATSSPAGVSLDVTFGVNSDALSAADKAAISNFVSNWHSAGGNDPVRVDGYASIDGPPSINWPLSCRRGETLAHELMIPSDGSPGIPASHISLFAQGETNQFSSALGPNRRAQAHIPALPRPVVPTTKVVKVDMLSFNGSTRNPYSDLAHANTIFRQCHVRFEVAVGASVDPTFSGPLMGNDTTFERATRGTNSAEESALIPAVTRAFNLNGRLRVLYFERINPGARGTSHRATGSTALTVNHVYMTNTAANRTLAHEFGHILLNGNFHHLPADNLMHPSNTATASNLTPTQCTTIRSNI